MTSRTPVRATMIALSLCALLAPGLASAAPKTKAAPKTPEAAAPSNPDEPIDTGVGTTIVGDQESPIGLYITPWKDEYAERGLDRPARLLDESLLPLDPGTFRRQIEYYETITAYRRSQRGEGK